MLLHHLKRLSVEEIKVEYSTASSGVKQLFIYWRNKENLSLWWVTKLGYNDRCVCEKKDNAEKNYRLGTLQEEEWTKKRQRRCSYLHWICVKDLASHIFVSPQIADLILPTPLINFEHWNVTVLEGGQIDDRKGVIQVLSKERDLSDLMVKSRGMSLNWQKDILSS